jgi:dienelactone hydrolase
MSRTSLFSTAGALFVLAFAITAVWRVEWATAQNSLPAAAFTRLSIPETYQGKTLQLDAWLSTPGGSGPFATVILAHGCNGVNPNLRSGAWPEMNKWARWLNQESYAALILDSFTPRGVSSVCGGVMGDERARELFRLIPVDVRALDIYVAADYLAKMPQIDPQRFGTIGFSHGGAAIVRAAAMDNTIAEPGRAALAADRGRIAAFVGMYPGCKRSTRSTFIAPLLILVGTDDVRTPAAVCEQLAEQPRAGSPVTIKVYPGATHSFDVEKSDRQTRFGDTMRYSATATADAQMRIKDFFVEYLTGRDGALSTR